jgi:hypothetical protein
VNSVKICTLTPFSTPAGHRAGLGKGGEEKTAVVVVMENRLTSVATRHHVVKGAGKFDTQAPWHAAKIGQR